MTRRLILIRHAKSGWDDPFADDHERVLTDRGRAGAAAIGTWLENHGYRPDKMIVSDARRTFETAQLVLAGLSKAPDVVYSGKLYHAAPDTILDLAKRETAQALAVVGHNPGIGMLADYLVASRPDHHRFDDYPTGATTVMDFAEGDWLKPRHGKVVDFTVPRDLTA